MIHGPSLPMIAEYIVTHKEEATVIFSGITVTGAALVVFGVGGLVTINKIR